MIRKAFAIFGRDLKVSLRDFIALYIIIFPVLFSIIINIFTPGINDTTVSFAMIDEANNSEHIEYFEKFAKIEVFPDMEAIRARLERRDHIVAVLSDEGDELRLLRQGNEPESLIDNAKLLMATYHFGVTVDDSSAVITEFDREIPPMKNMFVNGALMMISILGGMLIAINIVEEKVDHTLSAINVTTISRWGYILGKSMIGLLIPIIGSVVMIFMTGFGDVNLMQMLVMVLTSCIISVLVGFIEGINNDDIMNAAGNIKILFLPLFGSIAAYNMLADKWQPLFYWIPFYWTYKGNEMILTKSGTWGQILLYAGIVTLISSVVFIALAPKIRKGLE